MDPKQLEQLIVENNQLLHRIDRRMKIAQYMRVVYWTIIIAGAIGLYSITKPFVEQVNATQGQIQQTVKSFTSLQDILK
jgi:hypothetical protein